MHNYKVIYLRSIFYFLLQSNNMALTSEKHFSTTKMKKSRSFLQQEFNLKKHTSVPLKWDVILVFEWTLQSKKHFDRRTFSNIYSCT